MSTAIFSFTPMVGLREGRAWRTLSDDVSNGQEQRRKMWPYAKLTVDSVSLRFPPNIATTFDRFFDARAGGYDTFLYKPLTRALSTSVLESLGTGDNVVTSFPLTFKYVDSSSIITYVDGVVTTGASVTSNNTAPRMLFTTAPSGPITATYEYYYPMKFVTDSYALDMHNYGATDGDTLYTVELSLVQDSSGSHIA